MTQNLPELSRDRGIHSEFGEHSWNLLGIMMEARKAGEDLRTERLQRHNKCNYSECGEPSQDSLNALNVGKSRVQAADRVLPQQVSLMGYKHFPREM